MLEKGNRRAEGPYGRYERGIVEKGSNPRGNRIRKSEERPAHFGEPSKAERCKQALEMMERVGTSPNVIIKSIWDLVDDITN